MVDGTALKDVLAATLPDFIGQDPKEAGQTMSRTGEVKAVAVWKCPQCGMSVEQIPPSNGN